MLRNLIADYFASGYSAGQASQAIMTNFEEPISDGVKMQAESYYNGWLAGIVPGKVVSDSMLRIVREPAERDHNHDDEEPPKPPSRPNARIGKIVLEDGF